MDTSLSLIRSALTRNIKFNLQVSTHKMIYFGIRRYLWQIAVSSFDYQNKLMLEVNKMLNL